MEHDGLKNLAGNLAACDQVGGRVSNSFIIAGDARGIFVFFAMVESNNGEAFGLNFSRTRKF